ncbi:MAG: right-handed parallel beta-helix repeat-containing protein, partial [Saprospiraceae bacterium]
MVVLFVLLFLGSCTIPKEVASIYDYGIKDSVPVNHKKAQVFFDENEIIEIPSDMLFVVNGDLVLKGKKTLIINGTLKGIQANERIITDGDVRIIGKGNLVRFAVEVRGGTFSMSDVSIAKTGRTAAILINNKDKVVEDFKVSGVNIKDCAFGILRQGKGGQLPVRYGLIENCSISDCRGDGIEWNIGNKDGKFEILNNKINNINSDLRGPISEEWGIGIGVAGKGYSDDFSNCVKNFRIEGNVIENVRHGIHVEAGRDFTIKNNKVVTNSKVSLRSQKLLSLVGIAVYGSKNYVIEQNEILAKKGRAMENQFGSLPKIWYLASPTNYKVIGNKIEGGVINWCSGDGNEVLVEGNTIKGKLLHRGAAKHLLKNNTILSNGDKLGLEIDFFGTKDSRAKYNAKSDFLILDVNNKVTDSKGKESKLIKSKNKIKIYQNLSDYNNNRRR